MKKSLPVWGLCALMSAGSILSASEAPASAAANRNEVVVPVSEKMGLPLHGRRRPGKNVAAPRRRMEKSGSREEISGRGRGRHCFQSMQRKSRDGSYGLHHFMPWRKGKFNIWQVLIPRGPMNEDESAGFALLTVDLRDALEIYRYDSSEINRTALRATVEKLVTAAQQYEIERCEKALARAKAAAARKDKIVARTMRKFTAPPRPGPMMPLPPRHPAAVR